MTEKTSTFKFSRSRFVEEYSDLVPGARRTVWKAGSMMAVFVLIWALVEVIGASAGVPPIEVVWFRYATHLLFMVLVYGPRHGTALARTIEPLGWHILRSAMMLGMPLFFVASVRKLSFADAMAVFWLCPFLLLAMSIPVAGYRLRMRDILAVVTGFAGVVAIVRPAWTAISWNAVLPLTMGLCFVVYQILTRGLRADSHAVRLFHTALWVFVPVSCYVPFVWQTPSWRGAAAMAVIGVLGWIGLYALDIAVDTTPPAAFAAFALLQPVWSLIFESTIHGFMPARRQVAGCILVLVALSYYVFAWDRKPQMRARAAASSGA
jgi:drug/metabolite transporter (DMT)-like permease